MAQIASQPSYDEPIGVIKHGRVYANDYFLAWIEDVTRAGDAGLNEDVLQLMPSVTSCDDDLKKQVQAQQGYIAMLESIVAQQGGAITKLEARIKDLEAITHANQ